MTRCDQTRGESAVETTVQQVVGYLAAVALQHFVFRPLFDIPGGVGGTVGITGSFAALAWVRSYLIRRWFARKHVARLTGVLRPTPHRDRPT